MFLVVYHELDDYWITLFYLIVCTKNRNVVSEHSFNNCYMWDYVLMHDDTCLMYAWVWLITSCVKSLTWYHHHHCQLWKEILKSFNLNCFWACLMHRFRFSIIKYINYADKSSQCSVKTVLSMKINSDIMITSSESFFCVSHH